MGTTGDQSVYVCGTRILDRGRTMFIGSRFNQLAMFRAASAARGPDVDSGVG